MTNRYEQIRTEADDPTTDRLIYATFPRPLKDAMKSAAQRWNWDRATWALQTQMLQEAMLAGRATADELASAYAAPPST